jgi:hypothetical protein
MNNYTIVPSNLRYKSAPFVDEEISLSLNSKQQEITEYDRSQTLSLAQVYDDERQKSTIFRPTFKISYLYDNTYTGTTTYIPFRNNLYLVDNENSVVSGVWKGFPQFYEFDFYRPDVQDQHISYKAKSALTYNWMYYLTYDFENQYNKQLTYYSNNTPINWVAGDGIPFEIINSQERGNNVIRFNCIAPHGLLPNEFVELSISYKNNRIFQVLSLGNGLVNSEPYIFNVLNVGYTGSTFNNGTKGTFKRVLNPDNLSETRSKYYVKKLKVLTNVEDIVVTKAGFEKNVFSEEKKYQFSSLTPNNLSRITQKTSSNAYTFTVAYDLDFAGVRDNQNRPISQINLSIINKGYSGYFNQPNNGIGLKQGWEFNLSKTVNPWWDLNNTNSNTNIQTSAYTLTSGATKTFYYNLDLKRDDIIDGDFCEWNDYTQVERVVSPYYQKIKFNQNVFQTTNTSNSNTPGYYYKPHLPITLRVFSDYVETGDVENVDGVPSWAFYSTQDQEFRWRDLYSYGFIDEQDRGVDYPFFNTAQYPFADEVFRLIPEGVNYNEALLGVEDVTIKPLIDGCE